MAGWAGVAGAEPAFWRPISVGLYWSIVHGVFGNSSLAAHLLNLLILGAAAAAGGALGCTLAGGDGRGNGVPLCGYFWATLLFGLNGCWLLPVVWTCAMQETLACLFSALSLLAFSGFLRLGITTGDRPGMAIPARRWQTIGLGTAALIFFALALLSKEGTVVVILLAGLIALHWRVRFDRRLAVLAFGGVAILGVWFVLRSRLTALPVDSPYTPTVGLNIFRNGLALFLFLLNFPREAMVGWISSRSASVLVWGLVCFALQAAAVAGFVRLVLPRLRWRVMVAWVAVALMPYLFLRSQSYPYYGCLALLAYPWLIAQASASHRRGFGVCSALAAASSLCLFSIEPFLPRPAPIARAQWAQHALSALALHKTEAGGSGDKIALVMKDEPSYAAGGYSAGPALALGIRQEQLVDVMSTGPVLSINMAATSGAAVMADAEKGAPGYDQRLIVDQAGYRLE